MKKSLFLALLFVLGVVMNARAGFISGPQTYYYVGYIAEGQFYPTSNITTIVFGPLEVYVEYDGVTYDTVSFKKPDRSNGYKVNIQGVWYTLGFGTNEKEHYTYRTLSTGLLTKVYVDSKKIATQMLAQYNGGSTGGSAGGGVYTAPSQGASSSGTTSTRRTCPGCNGTGKGPDQITYAPNYTGNDNSTYCQTCGRTMARHTHRSAMCRTCNGRGYVQ